MKTSIDRAPFTGAMVSIFKQNSVKSLCADMVRAGIIPDIRITGYSGGVSGFIYNSEIHDIYTKHETAIDILIDDLADDLGSHPYTLIAECAENYNLNSAEYLYIGKCICAIEHLAFMMDCNGTVKTTFDPVDNENREFDIREIDFSALCEMRSNENYDLIDTILTRDHGMEIEMRTVSDDQLIITEITENARVEYRADFYVYLHDQFICVI